MNSVVPIQHGLIHEFERYCYQNPFKPFTLCSQKSWLTPFSCFISPSSCSLSLAGLQSFLSTALPGFISLRCSGHQSSIFAAGSARSRRSKTIFVPWQAARDTRVDLSSTISKPSSTPRACPATSNSSREYRSSSGTSLSTRSSCDTESSDGSLVGWVE